MTINNSKNKQSNIATDNTYDFENQYQSEISTTHLSSTHSTNSQLIDWMVLSYQDQSPTDHNRPHLLTADTQSGGRGQHGRTWQSPLGNVYLSLYVPTQAYAWQQNLCLSYRLDGRLSLCVGYQLSQIPIIEHINQTRLAKHLPSIGVKWVNDVGFYQPQDNLPDQFQKLSGILIEPVNVAGHMLGVVVGVGVNIAHAPALTQQTQEGLNYQAVSLQDLTKQRLQPRDFYQPISDAIANAIGQFNQLQAAEASQQFIHDFAQKDVLKNKHLQIHNALSEQSITGIAAGIDAQGCLLIEQADGSIQTIWTGTIQVLDSAVSSLQTNKHK